MKTKKIKVISMKINNKGYGLIEMMICVCMVVGLFIMMMGTPAKKAETKSASEVGNPDVRYSKSQHRLTIDEVYGYEVEENGNQIIIKIDKLW